MMGYNFVFFASKAEFRGGMVIVAMGPGNTLGTQQWYGTLADAVAYLPTFAAKFAGSRVASFVCPESHKPRGYKTVNRRLEIEETAVGA